MKNVDRLFLVFLDPRNVLSFFRKHHCFLRIAVHIKTVYTLPCNTLTDLQFIKDVDFRLDRQTLTRCFISIVSPLLHTNKQKTLEDL